jgi:hypothetical protein
MYPPNNSRPATRCSITFFAIVGIRLYGSS